MLRLSVFTYSGSLESYKKMTCERVGINVLVVDDDDTSLAIVTNILNSLEYKVLIAKGALNALETLREFGGFLDLVITELHISGMNGFEFLKRVESEFHLPVIMMSADRRKNVMSKSLANGAAHYILKPFCANDFNDIWQYAIAARKRKLSDENNNGESLTSDNIFTQDVDNSATSSNENKRKRKYCQRKSIQMDKENESEERPRLVKKPKVVWTAHLHNLFLVAIKQIGLERAVPKRILEVMNVPNLTRENVASHLQKYRLFLKKVAEKGLYEGLSNRDLKSRFASGLSASMIKEFQARNVRLNVPAQLYMKRVMHESRYREITNALKPYNHVSRSTNYMTNTLLGRCHQFPYPYHKGLNNGDSLNQARLGVQSSYGTNPRANNIQQKMFGSYANSLYCEKISDNNVGSVFPSDGKMEHGLMTSANGLRACLKYGDNQLMNQNNASLGNYHHKFSYGQENWNIGSLKNSNNNLPSTSSTNNLTSNIQLNGGSQMVGNGIKEGLDNIGVMDSIANNNNSFCLINETTQNANKNVAPLGQGNFGLAQEEYAFASSSSVGDEWPSELPTTLITNNGARVENLSQLPQQLDDNVEENDNAAMKDDFSDLFRMLDEMDLLIEPEECTNANEFSKSDFSSSSHIVQSREQSNSVVSDVIVNSIQSTINLSNESSTSSDKNCNQLGSDDTFANMGPLDSFMVDDVSSVSNLATEKDWDIELIEALFGDNETNYRGRQVCFKDHN